METGAGPDFDPTFVSVDGRRGGAIELCLEMNRFLSKSVTGYFS
jgi:hypothetical protein